MGYSVERWRWLWRWRAADSGWSGTGLTFTKTGAKQAARRWLAEIAARLRK